MPTSPESAVKKLARLPANCTCPNCGASSKYGFSTVCIKYLTFVCNNCKSSHQAVSHRCKSLTMSSWDQGEVLKLKKHGNDYARNVWLGRAPQCGTGGRPREGDDINVFKRFVVEAYEHKRYYVEPSGEGAPVAQPPSMPAARVSHAPAPVAMPRQPAPKPPVATPAPAPAVDLLDFDAFDSAPAPAPTSQPAAPAFDAFQSSSGTTVTAKAPAPAPFDPFGASQGSSVGGSHNAVAQPAPTPAVSNAAFGSTHSASATNVNPGASNASFDPFGGSLSTMSSVSATSGSVGAQGNAPMKTPVMNNAGGFAGGGAMAGSMMNGSMANNSMAGMNVSMMGNSMGGGMMNGRSMNQGNAMMMGSMMNQHNSMMSMGNGSAYSNISTSNGSSQMQMSQPAMAASSMMQTSQPAMAMNMMQPNSISNNFAGRPNGASSGGAASSKKPDPFAGLGF